MPVSEKIKTTMERSSWIRKMFEEGARLKEQFGADNVFDFSLGNPNLPPPPQFKEVLMELVKADLPGSHGYMPNAGFPAAREAVAAQVSKDQGAAVEGKHIIMTVGAGGALNTVLKAILGPGDEVVVSKPYFVEYNAYLDNHGGKLVSVDSAAAFDLDIEALAGAIGPSTRAVLINSPNNPTGTVYSRETLTKLAAVIAEKSAATGRIIHLISDEPYRNIAFDGVEIPGIFSIFPASIVCTSYSKDLSLAGERIGYIAVNPSAPQADLLLAGLALTNRILGFVNAPALMQLAVAKLAGVTIDIEPYRINRDLLYNGLKEAGYEVEKPSGAFYLFPKSPIPDDVAFVRELQAENILAVPGSGFFGPGYFRLAFCCSRKTVEGSLPGFKRAIARVKGQNG